MFVPTGCVQEGSVRFPTRMGNVQCLTLFEMSGEYHLDDVCVVK